MMKKIILLNKKEGETPLEALEAFRNKNKQHKAYKNEKITYAGRLDPMASGLLILLVGEKVHEKEKYLAFDKEYEFEILFGFATDTYDILGKIVNTHLRYGVDEDVSSIDKKIKDNLKSFTGKFIQKYPAYSSRTVKGKPMFEYAREGLEVEAPEREVNVKYLKFLKLRNVGSKKLLQNIERRIKKVNGDFRQKEILKIWHKNLNSKDTVCTVGSFKIKCSSGTYVRGIAHSLGERMGVPALAFSIKRTKIGKWRQQE